MVPRLLLLPLSGVLVFGANAAAQPAPSVAGVVRDSAGRPITSAEVSAGPAITRTDSVGRFYLAFTGDSVTVSVRRLGYRGVSFTLAASEATANDIDVILNVLPYALGAVDVEGSAERARTVLAEFDERRARGIGTFITSADIHARSVYVVSDVLRTQRGVMLLRNAEGRMTLRFVQGNTRNCRPMMWLDGQKVPELEIDDVPAGDVEGIELYRSLATTPAEFIRGAGQLECGVVVIWTRRPITMRP